MTDDDLPSTPGSDPTTPTAPPGFWGPGAETPGGPGGPGAPAAGRGRRSTPGPAAVSALRAGVIGALVGGLVGVVGATGVFFALDDDSGTVAREPSRSIVARPSTELDSSGNIAEVIAAAEPAVVAVTTDDGPGSGRGGAGTGFVISPDGFIVTNNHVVEGAAQIEVQFGDGALRSARIVGRDPSTDLAVLKVDAEGLPSIALGDSDAVQVGDGVVAIGNALALDGGLSVTQGIVSGLDREVQTNAGGVLSGMIQTDAAINPGNSGGPLLDVNGRVIGINTAIADPTSAQNVGFAIPISKAEPIIDDLRNGRAPAFLGVGTQDLTPQIARQLGIDLQEGAVVSSITPDSPADEEGVRIEDVIVEIGGERIAGSSDVQAAVRRHRPGDTVTVVLVRDGEQRSVEATLIERPDST